MLGFSQCPDFYLIGGSETGTASLWQNWNHLLMNDQIAGKLKGDFEIMLLNSLNPMTHGT